MKLNWAQDLVADLRYGARTLRKNPGFSAAAILTLALGIGANTAVFSVVDAVLLRPLPFKDADRLVVLTEYNPGKVDTTGVPYPCYIEWRKQNHVFDETAAYYQIEASNDIVLGTVGSAERVQFSIVTNSFFSILGVQPKLGRGFLEAEEWPGSAKVFLASDALWHRSFGADPHALGRTFLLDGENYTLVGVMPPGFDFPRGRDVWVPAGSLGERGIRDRVSHPFRVLGRLRHDVGLDRAQSEIDGIQRQLGRAYPATDAAWRVRIQSLIETFVGNSRRSLLVLLGAVTFILLIACANVVNLMLGRASARRTEFAIRKALGAGRSRLLRQSLAESLPLVALSVIVALLLAKWGLDAVLSVTTIQLARMETFHLNAPVLAFATAIAAILTMAVGIAPAFHTLSQESLRQKNLGPRNMLVITEIALALLLLCGAGLLLKSFVQLNQVDPGFNPEHIITMKIALPGNAYTKPAQTVAFLDRLLDKLRVLPGVKSAAATSTLPLSGEKNWGSFNIAGQPILDRSHAPAAEWRGVSANYLNTMEIPLLRGRNFEERDGQAVVIINETMARRFFPGANPIGQHLVGLDQPPTIREIVGVCANLRSFGLDLEDKPEMYTLYRGWWYMNLVLRTFRNPAAVVPAVRKQVAALDRGVPVYQVATMDQLLSRSTSRQRFNLLLLTLFALLALILAGVGIFGLLAFQVSCRTREIGIRMALGARSTDILRQILWQGMKLVLIGLALGLATSLALTRLMASLLYRVSSTDALTFGAVTVLLTLVALAACYIPARRAIRVDPTAALRCE